MNHEQYVQTLKASMVIIVLKAVMTKVITKLPFLGAPYISPVVSYLLSKLIEFIFNQAEVLIFLGYIDIRINAQGTAFIQAADLNLKAQQSGTPEEKKKAEEVLIEKFKAFARLTN